MWKYGTPAEELNPDLLLSKDTAVFKGERFNKQGILLNQQRDVTETFQYTHFSSCHQGSEKGS